MHFVLMPIFFCHRHFLFREITRLRDITIIFYQLFHEDESILVSFAIISLISRHSQVKTPNSIIFVIYKRQHIWLDRNCFNFLRFSYNTLLADANTFVGVLYR